MSVRTWKFQPERGPMLHAVSVTVAQPKAAFVFNHGYGEHTGRYSHFFQALAAKSIDCHSFDMRSFGASEPDPSKRGKVEHFRNLVDDLLQFSTIATGGYSPGVPVFIGGSSLGGLVCAHAVLASSKPFAGLLLFSPLIDVDWNPLLRVQAAIGKPLSMMLPWARIVPAVLVKDMSEDAQVRKDYVEDPLNFVGNVRSRSANQFLEGMRSLQPRYAEFTLPVYGHHGAHDRCTSVPAHRAFMASIKSADKTLNIVDGGYHELLMGPQKEACIEAIGTWMLERLRGPKAPSML